MVEGIGIVVIDGDNWKFQRKAAAHFLTVNNVKSFVEHIFSEKMVALYQVLENIAISGSEFDLNDLLYRFTMDCSIYIAYGVKLNSLTDKENTFARAFDFVQKVMSNRILDPTHFIKERFLQVGKDYQENVRIMRKYAADIIASRKKENTNPDKNMDYIRIFLEMKDEDGNPLFNDEELVDVTTTFLFAGRDSTAQALSWTFLCFAKNPRVQAKAIEEINQVLGDADMPTYEQCKNLTYVKACFLETVRLYPSVPRNTKMAVEDDVLPDGTFVPKGTYVLWSAYTMGRNPAVWGPDAEEYRPERWLERNIQPSQYEYSAFHAGPRGCLGRHMAEMESIFVLASLLKRFKFEPLDIASVTYSSSISLPMTNGLKGKIVKLE